MSVLDDILKKKQAAAAETAATKDAVQDSVEAAAAAALAANAKLPEITEEDAARAKEVAEVSNIQTGMGGSVQVGIMPISARVAAFSDPGEPDAEEFKKATAVYKSIGHVNRLIKRNGQSASVNNGFFYLDDEEEIALADEYVARDQLSKLK